MTWSGDLRAGMLTEEAVRDAASAQALKTEHDRVKAEVEAREENFTGLVQMADAMIQDGHYAAQVRRGPTPGTGDCWCGRWGLI